MRIHLLEVLLRMNSPALFLSLSVRLMFEIYCWLKSFDPDRRQIGGLRGAKRRRCGQEQARSGPHCRFSSISIVAAFQTKFIFNVHSDLP
jgi:hypothetical protein